MDTLAVAPAPPSRLRALLSRYRVFLLYAVIGGGALLFDVAIYALLTLLAGLHPVLANTVSVFTSMVFSFTLNSLANFKVRDRMAVRFMSFVLITGAGYLVSTAMLALLVDVLSVDALIAKGATLPVVLVLQYSLNKHFTFAAPTERTAA